MIDVSGNRDKAVAHVGVYGLVVHVTHEGDEMHIVRWLGEHEQHRFLRVDIHDDACVLARAEAQYLVTEIQKALGGPEYRVGARKERARER